MYDRFKKRAQANRSTPRHRLQIAREAARRLYDVIGPQEGDDPQTLRDASESTYYTAKRKAAAVLGHKVRPGDLPSDSEVREQVLALAKERAGLEADVDDDEDQDVDCDGEDEPSIEVMADHIDRFAIYKLRLEPLENVKQNPRFHPEGDALFHSLQVFELALEARPYDEEFLLAALLHDVGKAIDSQDHVAAAVESLRGAVTDRTLWLIEHHMDLLERRERPLSPRVRRAVESSEYFDDLKLLRSLDDSGRVPGARVGTLEQALQYIEGLEREDYLDA
ncbi:HD domain-containing protein [Singulisphaera sp. PoT]|uniref:HD domain-containing protein n=1 Tax=Singulisphaera sp. PoT TaxID=3411797 RepID=UPI003BF597AA